MRDIPTPRRRRVYGAIHRFAEFRASLVLATPEERAALLPKVIDAWKTVESELDAIENVPRHIARERTEEMVDETVNKPPAARPPRRGG